MGRETKFRAWDKMKESMSQVRTLDFDDNGYLEGAEAEYIGGIGRFEIMQYTGIKDKDGKEIYEGDICRQKFQKKIEIGEIALNPTRGYMVGKECIWRHDIEVIGNIYENSDLLKTL